MGKIYLVSIIERDEDEYDFYTEFKAFTDESKAVNFYDKSLREFLSNFDDNYVWLNTTDCDDAGNRYNTYTWNGGENHWEIQITELPAD